MVRTDADTNLHLKAEEVRTGATPYRGAPISTCPTPFQPQQVNIPQVSIHLEERGTVLLEQEWCGESDRIQLHPIHVRHLAELLGFLEPVKPCRTEKQSGEIK